MKKYVAWKFVNVDDMVLSLSILEVEEELAKKWKNWSESMNWREINPKVLAVYNKKRMVGALSENDYYLNDIRGEDIFDSFELASHNLIAYAFSRGSKDFA